MHAMVVSMICLSKLCTVCFDILIFSFCVEVPTFSSMYRVKHTRTPLHAHLVLPVYLYTCTHLYTKDHAVCTKQQNNSLQTHVVLRNLRVTMSRSQEVKKSRSQEVKKQIYFKIDHVSCCLSFHPDSSFLKRKPLYLFFRSVISMDIENEQMFRRLRTPMYNVLAPGGNSM